MKLIRPEVSGIVMFDDIMNIRILNIYVEL